MGILSRFSDIMSANVNSLLSKSEEANADKLLEKYLQDAKENLGQVKAETAAVIAEEMGLARKINDIDALHKKYGDYAAAAVKAQNEDDAKKFLAHQVDLENQKADLTKQYDAAKQNSEKMREMTGKLTEEISSAQAKLESAKQKLTVAKEQEKLNKFNESVNDSALGNFDNLFEQVQKRVDKAEAAASLNSTQSSNDIEDLAKKYEVSNDSSQAAASIEDRLAQLKANQ